MTVASAVQHTSALLLLISQTCIFTFKLMPCVARGSSGYRFHSSRSLTCIIMDVN
ncbi:hypothetical protein PF005_g25942 [Phytophthora fragariae]|uniref:Uncharacterized protein n=1 Tax=Phytophthora fragariae TaxID=53985 RepID=A0A6A3VT52_9STRA|nr:hypothetical protein PF003_g25649 [Phytophthora fragariae]KAE8923094.1 hypothetical protein PF009_g26650 [Phytophthora fragariae]KAE8961858.1 hypothetical protein PF011_g29593 [Phytophthora fragariae]KAE9061710.1 hypothetical protein PF010_g29714 [Phytophthora fragariae]KAE9066270.1 hypothetical protein PF007_g28538 [Phytophthora fragariae]